MKTQPFDPEYESIVAINTFSMLYRFYLEKGAYGNSPNTLEFDGSAVGYWRWRAEYFDASKEHLTEIMRDIEAQVAAEKLRLRKASDE